MSLRVKIVLAITCLSLSAGLAGWAWFLGQQGLDKADKWSSVFGSIASVLLGIAGLIFGVLSWFQTRSSQPIDSSDPGHGTRNSFNVQAGRDAYTAEKMFFGHSRNESSKGPDPDLDSRE
ncbi:hypothetical protein ACQP2Y_04355 [Actinoplanes sp. CA-051413]|uniref:hypothetical protein n=1 Tax=Actinoplanes sp. CA-051413 TaxID=3239899 RepID=UPI003D97AFE2